MRPGRGGGAGCQFRVCTAEVETGACPEQGCDGPGPAGRAGRQGWSERQGCGDHGLCGRWWSGVAACVDMAGCCGSARSDTPPAGAVRPVVSPCQRLTPCSTGHGRPDPRPSPPPTQSLEKKLYCVQSCAICSPARAGVRGLCGACSHTVFRPERSRSRGGSPRSGQGQVPVHCGAAGRLLRVLPGAACVPSRSLLAQLGPGFAKDTIRLVYPSVGDRLHSLPSGARSRCPLRSLGPAAGNRHSEAGAAHSHAWGWPGQGSLGATPWL